jgi:hypothetical protein
MRSFGILTFAFGQAYARHAYGLHLSAAKHGVPVTVVTLPDDETYQWLARRDVPLCTVTDKAKHPFWYEQHAYDKSPYDLTLKMDADCFIPADADMGLIRRMIEQSEIVNGVPHTLLHEPVYSVAYRDREVKMGLPTVYSTMFGFAKCTEAHLFFQHIKMFCAHWGSDHLPMTKGLEMTTDTLYSMAWAACHNPSAALVGLPFHHMKPITMGWGTGVREDWTREVPYQVRGTSVYVGGQCVSLPIHYQDKNFLSDAVLKELEEQDVRHL